MRMSLNIILALFFILSLLSCSSGFKVEVKQDPNDIDLTNIETNYMIIKQGDPADPTHFVMKLQSILSKEYGTLKNRIHFVFEGIEWTNLESVQIVASYSTYNLDPLFPVEKKTREPDGIEESMWVEIPKGVLTKIINSQKWSMKVHSQKRLFEFNMTEKDIENMESWLNEARRQRDRLKPVF